MIKYSAKKRNKNNYHINNFFAIKLELEILNTNNSEWNAYYCGIGCVVQFRELLLKKIKRRKQTIRIKSEARYKSKYFCYNYISKYFIN